MKQCSHCRKNFDKPLFRCDVLKEDWHGYRAEPDFKMIVGFKTLALCLKCKKAPIKFSDELYKASPYLKDYPTHPIPLMTHEKEKSIESLWTNA